MVHAARAELLAETLGGGKAKIGDRHAEATVVAEHVLRLEVTMVYSEGMAIFDGFEELEKDVFDEAILAEVSTAM